MPTFTAIASTMFHPQTPIRMIDFTDFVTLSPLGKHHIEDFFEVFCIYVTKRYGADLDDIICDWNMIGATSPA